MESSQCGRQSSSPHASIIYSASELERLYARIYKERTGSGNLLGKSFSASPEEAPKIDLKNNHVLLVEMGRKPTAGYNISYIDNSFNVKNSEAEVVVKWIEPGPDAIVAQVITSPCLVLSVPAKGYEDISIVDQDRRIRAKITL